MASTKELVSRATEIADRLGVEIDTEGKTNAEMADLIKELKAKQDEQAKKSLDDADKAKNAAAKAKEEEAAKRPPHYVAPGKALTTLKGIKSGDTMDEVKANMLPGGQKQLDELVAGGFVIKHGA